MTYRNVPDIWLKRRNTSCIGVTEAPMYKGVVHGQAAYAGQVGQVHPCKHGYHVCDICDEELDVAMLEASRKAQATTSAAEGPKGFRYAFSPWGEHRSGPENTGVPAADYTTQQGQATTREVWPDIPDCAVPTGPPEAPPQFQSTHGCSCPPPTPSLPSDLVASLCDAARHEEWGSDSIGQMWKGWTGLVRWSPTSEAVESNGWATNYIVNHTTGTVHIDRDLCSRHAMQLGTRGMSEQPLHLDPLHSEDRRPSSCCICATQLRMEIEGGRGRLYSDEPDRILSYGLRHQIHLAVEVGICLDDTPAKAPPYHKLDYPEETEGYPFSLSELANSLSYIKEAMLDNGYIRWYGSDKTYNVSYCASAEEVSLWAEGNTVWTVPIERLER